MDTCEPIQTSKRKVTFIGIVGLCVGLLALVAAVLSPWVIDALLPDRRPLDQVVVEVAGRIKDRLAAEVRGEDYVAPAQPQRTRVKQWYTAGVVGAGVLAVCIGVVGLVAGHDVRLNAAATGVGAAAVIFQFALMIAAAVLVILLIAVVVSMLVGGGG